MKIPPKNIVVMFFNIIFNLFQVKKIVTNLLEPDISKRWNLNQILNSEWIAMDPRLLGMTPAEKMAVTNAQEERRKMFAQVGGKLPKVPSNTKVIMYKSCTARQQ